MISASTSALTARWLARRERELTAALKAGVEVRGVDRRDDKCGGSPCVAGTRLRVWHVWKAFLGGMSMRRCASGWNLTTRQVEDAVRALCVPVLRGKRRTR